jgi:hypothetical protein
MRGEVDIWGFVLNRVVSCHGKRVFSCLIQSLKGEQIWHTRVKIAERLQVNLDICAIPVEMRPSAVFAALPRRIPNTCAGINWRP